MYRRRFDLPSFGLGNERPHGSARIMPELPHFRQHALDPILHQDFDIEEAFTSYVVRAVEKLMPAAPGATVALSAYDLQHK